MVDFIKGWWRRNIIDVCPPECNDYFDYNPKLEGTLWRRKKL